MSSTNLIRWAGIPALLAGALFIAADLLSLSIFPKFPSVESLTSGPYAFQSVLKLAAGGLGLAGFLAAFSGTALTVGALPALGTLLVVGFPTGVLFSAAVMWLGYALWKRETAGGAAPAEA